MNFFARKFIMPKNMMLKFISSRHSIKNRHKTSRREEKNEFIFI